MRKILVCLLFLAIPLIGFSQEEKKEKLFSHTISNNIGIIIPLDLDWGYYPYPTFDGTKYSYLNFILSYELGFKNMVFAKLKFRNLRNTYYDDYPFFRENNYSDAYSIIFTYNTLWKKSKKLLLKVGQGFSIFNWHTKYERLDGYGNYLSTEYSNHNSFGFLVSLGLSYKIIENFAVGLDIDLYYLILFREYSLSFSYTF